MKSVNSYCGMNCLECPILIATQKNDDSIRMNIAVTWSAMADILIRPEEINCNGCKTGISSFGKCQDCEIRKCGELNHVENCAHCKEYSCEILKERHDFDPSNKKVLDEIRIELGINR